MPVCARSAPAVRCGDISEIPCRHVPPSSAVRCCRGFGARGNRALFSWKLSGQPVVPVYVLLKKRHGSLSVRRQLANIRQPRALDDHRAAVVLWVCEVGETPHSVSTGSAHAVLDCATRITTAAITSARTGAIHMRRVQGGHSPLKPAGAVGCGLPLEEVPPGDQAHGGFPADRSAMTNDGARGEMRCAGAHGAGLIEIVALRIGVVAQPNTAHALASV